MAAWLGEANIVTHRVPHVVLQKLCKASVNLVFSGQHKLSSLKLRDQVVATPSSLSDAKVIPKVGVIGADQVGSKGLAV